MGFHSRFHTSQHSMLSSSWNAAVGYYMHPWHRTIPHGKNGRIVSEDWVAVMTKLQICSSHDLAFRHKAGSISLKCSLQSVGKALCWAVHHPMTSVACISERHPYPLQSVHSQLTLGQDDCCITGRIASSEGAIVAQVND